LLHPSYPTVPCSRTRTAGRAEGARDVQVVTEWLWKTDDVQREKDEVQQQPRVDLDLA